MKNFDKIRIHFIGIGGISMSALAQELSRQGAVVSGSDMTASHITSRLSGMGIKTYIGHRAENVSDAEIVVKNSAIREGNPELIYAKENNLTIIERAELLGIIMSKYKSKIALSGMHGKTTATGLVASVLRPLSPSVHIGGELNKPSSPQVRGEVFVTEACEYYRNFLHLSPDTLVVLNIDEDHLDYFSGIEDIICAFDECAKHTKKHLIINADDKNCLKLTHDNIITFGIDSPADYRASDIVCNRGRYSFSVKNQRINLGNIGHHQIYNALAAFAVGEIYGIHGADIVKGIEEFEGVKRRFELFSKKINGADVIIDYAHHPREIAALISATDKIGYKKVFCVFQPHTYSRTESLLEDFSQCFDGVGEVILMPVYAAREKPDKVDSRVLFEKIKGRPTSPSVVYIESGDEVIEYIRTNVCSEDAVLIVGAGNVVDICQLI